MAPSLMLLPQLSQSYPGPGSHAILWFIQRFTFGTNQNEKPNWPKVILTLDTTVGLWVFRVQQHEEDILEYERRKGLE
uniref:NADH dehydrogenase [ubiquinone] 1 subunit C1, mitochondrial n=1 Tax=Vombatus ursinus TaxID=29139 RepID=A0A4X2M7B6_VOMUR